MSEAGNAIKSTSNSTAIWGVLTIVLGVLAMGSPFVTGLAITIMTGIILLTSGVTQMIFAFKADSLGNGIIRFLFCGVTIVAGLLVISQPALGLATLALFLTGYLIVDGLFSMIAAFSAPDNKAWWMISGLLSLVLGIVLWQGGAAYGAWVIGVLVGIRLVFSGIMMVAIGAAGRRVGKFVNQQAQAAGSTDDADSQGQ